MQRILLVAIWGLLFPTVSYSYTFDSDVPVAIQAQMKGDMAFIGSVQGDGVSPLHVQIFGNVDGRAYDAFFRDRVKSVGVSECGGGAAVACVMPYYDSTKIWLTSNFIKFSHPQIARTMVVFHESRHTEDAQGNWSHVRCPRPFLDEDGKEMRSIWTGAPLAGQPGCDVTALGAYGMTVVMMKNIQKYCSNCTDKVKMDAGIYADDQLKRVIDRSAKTQLIQDLYQ